LISHCLSFSFSLFPFVVLLVLLPKSTKKKKKKKKKKNIHISNFSPPSFSLFFSFFNQSPAE